VTRSVAAAEDIATPLAAIAVVVRGRSFQQLQMIHRGAAPAQVPRVRVWRAARARVTKITNDAFGFTSVSDGL
jgi:hypothetical protein